MLWVGGWGSSFPVDVRLRVCCFVCFLLPLDAQSQNDAVVPLEGFLTLVGGAGVPYLRAREEGKWKHRSCLCAFLGLLTGQCLTTLFWRGLKLFPPPLPRSVSLFVWRLVFEEGLVLILQRQALTPASDPNRGRPATSVFSEFKCQMLWKKESRNVPRA